MSGFLRDGATGTTRHEDAVATDLRAEMAETMKKRGKTIGKTREDCRENNGENDGEHGKTIENLGMPILTENVWN